MEREECQLSRCVFDRPQVSLWNGFRKRLEEPFPRGFRGDKAVDKFPTGATAPGRSNSRERMALRRLGRAVKVWSQRKTNDARPGDLQPLEHGFHQQALFGHRQRHMHVPG